MKRKATAQKKPSTKKAEVKHKGYIIDGRRYCPDESTPLCSYEAIMETKTLYISKQGTFFVESKGDLFGTPIEILNEENAHEFLNEHPGGIIEENYARVFGKPEQG